MRHLSGEELGDRGGGGGGRLRGGLASGSHLGVIGVSPPEAASLLSPGFCSGEGRGTQEEGNVCV